MFRSLRWQLAFWFAGLAGVLYVVSTLLAGLLYWNSLSAALDDETYALEKMMLPEISFSSGKPNLETWAKASGIQQVSPTPRISNAGNEGDANKTSDAQDIHNHFRMRATFQLFDSEKNLLAEYGPGRMNTLMGADSGSTGEASSGSEPLRWRVKKLLDDGQDLKGFLQIQLTTLPRDLGVKKFALTMLEIAPFLLFGLGACGYYVAGRAIRPIEENYALFRSFMADAGHELGSPLAIIQVNAEAMESDLQDSGLNLDKIGFILSTTERMTNIVKDLMYLARTESSATPAKITELKLDELVRSTAGEFAELFKESDIQFDFASLNAASVIGDADLLKRLLTNLLQNALRYTNPGGSVTVTLVSQARTTTLSVIDTGIGIPEESLAKIFERFYRVDKSRSRARGGSGLGLSIVKAIIDQHNGKIEVSSEFGKGSQFRVVLPRIS